MVRGLMTILSKKDKYDIHLFPVLKHEHLYLENLPTCDTYEKSYMHRDVITHVIITK